MTRWKYLIAMLGGFQYGYTIAVMAGALLFLTPIYRLDPLSQGFIVSAILIGALVGAALAGRLAELLGRKRGQMVIAVLFFIGALTVILSSSFTGITIGRIIQGIACGAISVIGPMYIAEISPAISRGSNVSFYQVSVTLGILCAYFISFLFSEEGAWRWMFALGMIPALFHGTGFYFLPDSQPQIQKEVAPWKILLTKPHRPGLFLALFLNFFQQAVGINAIIYFAPVIFENCGIHGNASAIFSAVLIGIINFLVTVLATFLVDRKGRRPLLMVSTLGMGVSLVALFFSCFFSPWFSILSLMSYIGSFAIGMGCVTQLMTSEFFCNSVRSRGVSFSTFVGWFFNFLVVITFMGLVGKLTQSGTFLLYAFFSFLSFVFMWKWIPETNGRPLT